MEVTANPAERQGAMPLWKEIEFITATKRGGDIEYFDIPANAADQGSLEGAHAALILLAEAAKSGDASLFFPTVIRASQLAGEAPSTVVSKRWAAQNYLGVLESFLEYAVKELDLAAFAKDQLGVYQSEAEQALQEVREKNTECLKKLDLGERKSLRG